MLKSKKAFGIGDTGFGDTVGIDWKAADRDARDGGHWV